MPTATISITDGANDGWVIGQSGSWPPTYLNPVMANEDILVVKRWSGTDYVLCNGLMRFDTSVIPDDATIVSAKLQLHTVNAGGSDGVRALTAEYKAWTPAKQSASRSRNYWRHWTGAGGSRRLRLTEVRGIEILGSSDRFLAHTSVPRQGRLRI